MNDEMTALREAGQSLDAPGGLPDGLRERVVGDFVADGGRAADGVVVPFRSRRRLWTTAAVGVAATAAAVVGASGVLGGPERGPEADGLSDAVIPVDDGASPGVQARTQGGAPAVVTAAAVLHHAAQAAVAEAWGQVPDEKFVYYAVEGCEAVPVDDFLAAYEYERWLSVDGSRPGRVIRTDDWTAHPAGTGQVESFDEKIPVAEAWPGVDRDAPAEAAAMYDYLLGDHVADPAKPRSEADVRVGRARDLLAGHLMPEQQAAVFGALELVDGATVVADVTDEAGRPGVGVRIGATTFVFEPGSYRYLGAQETLEDGSTCGEAVTALRLVDAVGER